MVIKEYGSCLRLCDFSYLPINLVLTCLELTDVLCTIRWPANINISKNWGHKYYPLTFGFDSKTVVQIIHCRLY